jgi:hypothetical protein
VEILKEDKDFFRRCVDAARTLDTKRIGLGCGKGEQATDQKDNDKSKFLDHGKPPMEDNTRAIRQAISGRPAQD